MKEIKVGDYVRINNDFRLIALGIGKVVGINKDSIYVKMNFELPFSFKKENIAKHSKQLIDLIETGDYVNGHLVEEVRISCFSSSIFVHEYEIELHENDIKTILTKEQMKANCYKVGGEDE